MEGEGVGESKTLCCHCVPEGGGREGLRSERIICHWKDSRLNKKLTSKGGHGRVSMGA